MLGAVAGTCVYRRYEKAKAIQLYHHRTDMVPDSGKQINEKYGNLFSPAIVNDTEASRADEEFMLKATRFIAENISNDSLNARMLIDHMCMGRANFYKKFKSLTGLGVMEYVTEKRMAIATDLLKNSKMPVSEIAFKVGYSDTSYFSAAFKQHFGYTPSECRKRVAQKEEFQA